MSLKMSVRALASGLFILCFAIAGPTPARAQSFTGQIVGTVTDQSGAILPGVSITITHLGTNAVREVLTNEAGGYTAPGLSAGEYRIEARLSGFRTEIRTGIVVQVNQIARANFELTVGEVAQTIEVTGAAPLIETDSAAVGQVIDRKKIDDLPLNGRNFLQLSFLAPGIVPLSQGENTAARGGNAHINGGREWQNNFILDGVDNNDLANGEIRLLPSVDALSEFKVQTSAFSAEFGRAVGGVVNLTTKSGSNEFHGTAFGFLRNDNLDARNAFALQKPEFKRNQFGGTIGGPILKNKTFFFFNYEGARIRNAVSRAGLLPTRAMKNGDFSEFSTPVIDPVTRTQFPGNRIPTNRISARSRAVLVNFPDPQIDSATRGSNYFSSAPFPNNVDQFTVRIDQRINSEHNFFARYTLADDFALNPLNRTPIPGFGDDVIKNPQSLSLFLTSVLTPSLVAETKFGYSRSNTTIVEEQRSREKFWAKALGFSETQAFSSNNALIQKHPGISIPGYDTPTGNNGGFARFHNNWHVSEALSWTRGVHSFKFGGEFRREGMNLIFPSDTAGTYTFNRSFTGNNFADFLLGYLGQVNRKNGNSVEHERGNSMGFFWQDDWRVNRRLSLNFGVRYELQLPLHEIRNLWQRWNFATGQLERLGVETKSSYAWDTDKNNWGPRFGLSYDVTGQGKTVIRLGGGVFYDVLLHNYPYTMFLGPPSSQQESRTTTVYNGIPFDSPFPNPPAIVVTPNTDINTVVPDSASTYTMRWSLSLQHALQENLLLDLTYVGSNSLRDRLSHNANQPLVIGNPNSRPYPQIGSISAGTTDGKANYHSGQAKLEQRAYKGLTMITSYTWSKNIDVGGNSSFGNSSSPQDTRDRHKGERALSAFDHRHRLSWSFLYDIPLGANLNGAAEKVLGGWQFSGIVTLQTGQPLTIQRSGILPGFRGGNSLRPDQICDPKLDNATPERWFKTECFVHPGDRFGTAGRSTITAPGQNQWDLSLIKNTGLTESTRLQMRFEFFNAFNRPQYFAPNVTFVPGAVGAPTGSPAFGRITQAGDARQIQLGLKLFF